MNYKSLGNKRVKIGAIGLGTNFVGENSNNDKHLIRLLQQALDLGINFFDTAEVYLNGRSELLIGRAFKKKREKVFLATKFSPENCSYKKVLEAAERSLKRLHTNYIDLYQIHWPNLLVPIDETMVALEKLVKEGKVKHIGVCNFSPRQLKNASKASKLPIVSLQTEYNLLERSAEQDLFPYCKKNRITVIAYTPLNSGNILKKEKYLEIFSNLTKKYNKTASQIILNFLISHSPVIAIPATTNITHLEENAKSVEFMLDKADIQLLSKIFTRKVTYIDTKRIKVTTIADHAAYRTVEEALVNKLNFFPSPLMLSEEIREGDFLKPVKVKTMQKKDDIFEYELLGGRIRYWAWVIAYNGKKPIPAIIED